MAGSISQTMVSSFKVELLDGYHAFGPGYRSADTFKIALLQGTVNGTYNYATTNYSQVTANSDEVVASGYTAGGNTLVISNPPSSGPSPVTTAWLNFSATTWATSIASSGALIYNATQGGRAVAVLSFGGIITASPFVVNFPTAAASTAIIQIQ